MADNLKKNPGNAGLKNAWLGKVRILGIDKDLIVATDGSVQFDVFKEQMTKKKDTLANALQAFGDTHQLVDLMFITGQSQELEVGTHSDLSRVNEEYNRTISDTGNLMTADHQPQDDIMQRIKNVVFKERATGNRDWLFGSSHRITTYDRSKGICMNMTRSNHDKMPSSQSADITPVFKAMGMNKEPPVSRHFALTSPYADDSLIEADTKADAMAKCKKALNDNLDTVGGEVQSAYSDSPYAPMVPAANSRVKSGNKAAWPEIF